MLETELPSGLVHADRMPPEEIDRLCAELRETKRDGPGDDYCFLGEHVEAPFGAVVDYCARIENLEEWTINIRKLRPAGGGLHVGAMVFAPADAARPGTDIFLRVDVLRGREQALVSYPCSWDGSDELWMRYYFTLVDARGALGRPGTLVLWVNCKHPYYDRATERVPAFVAAGRTRADRPWAGDAWPLFPVLHRLELDNLKRVLEHRFGGGKTR